MGEITEMILEGVLDEDGGYIGGTNKVSCPQCHKRVKPAGLSMHIRDVHGTPADKAFVPLTELL